MYAKIPRAHKSIALSTVRLVNNSGEAYIKVPLTSSELMYAPKRDKSKSIRSGYPSFPIRIFYSFKSQYMTLFWCIYYNPKITPAKIILIPYYPNFLKASPLPLVFSRNVDKSPPSYFSIS